MVDAKWYEGIRNLLEALAAEQCSTRDSNARRSRSRGGTRRAEKKKNRLKPMLDVAKAVAQELWLKNGRRFTWDDNRRIATETSKRLPDDRKGLVVDLTRPRLDEIRNEIKVAFPPVKPGSQ